jgi:hypothetical protein
MSGKPIRLPRSLVALLLLHLLPVLSAADSRELAPRFPRYERPRAAATRPQRDRAVPEDLRIASDTNDAVPRAARPAADQRVAASAGRSAALEAFRTNGQREYYRAGLSDGLHEALEDAGLARPARLAGEDAGRHDAEARAAGEAEGLDEAERRATPEAQRQVVDQFRDLEHEPLYRPRHRTPAYDPPLPVLPEPSLRDVFNDLGSGDFGHEYDAWRIYDSPSRDVVHNEGWSSPRVAFDRWLHGPDRSLYFRLSSSAEREMFEQAFRSSFSRSLAREYEEYGRRSYQKGFDDGWIHGAYVHQEWAFRLGFTDGLRIAFREAARLSFHGSYGESYESAYARAYDEWSLEPRPEITGTSLVDGNADGVFEPGENLRVRYDLVNYGGRGGRVTLRLTGEALADPVRQTVEIPRRRSLPDAGTLQATIAPTTLARNSTSLALRLDGQTRRIALRVAYPLEIGRGDIRVMREDIAGELLVDASVTNRSLASVDAAIELRTPALPDLRDTREVTSLMPGETMRATFAVTGLDPLELMAGRVRLELNVVRDGVVRDEVVHHLPDAVRDLGDRTLLRYMTRLARAERLSPSQLLAVHELLMLRLREDWKVAVIGKGNPYKADYKNRGASTALGDLVRTVCNDGSATSHPEVFAGLRADVTGLADSMPGFHPFLRKSMRRLASRLP